MIDSPTTTMYCRKCERTRIHRTLRPRDGNQTYVCKTCKQRKTFKIVEQM